MIIMLKLFPWGSCSQRDLFCFSGNGELILIETSVLVNLRSGTGNIYFTFRIAVNDTCLFGIYCSLMKPFMNITLEWLKNFQALIIQHNVCTYSSLISFDLAFCSSMFVLFSVFVFFFFFESSIYFHKAFI